MRKSREKTVPSSDGALSRRPACMLYSSDREGSDTTTSRPGLGGWGRHIIVASATSCPGSATRVACAKLRTLSFFWLVGMSEFCRRFLIADQRSAGETLKVLLDNEHRFYSKREFFFDAETCVVSPLDRAKMIEWMYRQVLCIANGKSEKTNLFTVQVCRLLQNEARNYGSCYRHI